MKKHIFLAITAIAFFCSAIGAQNQSGTHCSYFITNNWECEYPGMFSATFEPETGILKVEPKPGSFAGITSLKVFTDINCGSMPECTYQFPTPLKTQANIPQQWWDCALAAQPLFIEICWKEKPVAQYPPLRKE